MGAGLLRTAHRGRQPLPGDGGPAGLQRGHGRPRSRRVLSQGQSRADGRPAHRGRQVRRTGLRPVAQRPRHRLRRRRIGRRHFNPRRVRAAAESRPGLRPRIGRHAPGRSRGWSRTAARSVAGHSRGGPRRVQDQLRPPGRGVVHRRADVRRSTRRRHGGARRGRPRTRGHPRCPHAALRTAASGCSCPAAGTGDRAHHLVLEPHGRSPRGRRPVRGPGPPERDRLRAAGRPVSDARSGSGFSWSAAVLEWLAAPRRPAPTVLAPPS